MILFGWQSLIWHNSYFVLTAAIDTKMPSTFKIALGNFFILYIWSGAIDSSLSRKKKNLYNMQLPFFFVIKILWTCVEFVFPFVVTKFWCSAGWNSLWNNKVMIYFSWYISLLIQAFDLMQMVVLFFETNLWPKAVARYFNCSRFFIRCSWQFFPMSQSC